MRNEFIAFAVLSTAITLALGYWVHPYWYALGLLVGPLIAMGICDMVQTKHAIMRNFPILGRGRYVMEEWRPKLYQYFIESDTNGTPINRVDRSVVYRRAKDVLDTSPFGTQTDVYSEGYEWMNHSIGALDAHTLHTDLRVQIGGPDCSQPYSCSVLNVSAMSYGSLSKAAIEALNGGAAEGGFAHNTGEGGISPYHLSPGGDLIYQIGTGYFGSCDKKGNFSETAFAEQTARPSVKMVEVKLSQGAKPGHGGILPGKKNTPEIAKIRGVKQGVDVLSPPYHRAFSNPKEMLVFLNRLRELSGGKPIGFKLCVGHRSEFLAICKAMQTTRIYPDFISVDGAEGGTGAAPIEFSDSVGMPFREGLAFVHDALVGFGLREHITIMAAGKIITGFHMFRAMALGADVCMSARAMMLALGCIQAMECNKNSCPTGVATQDPELVAGLVVADKKKRVASFHRETVESFVELLAAAGLKDPGLVTRQHILRRVSMNQVNTYQDVFPGIPPNSLRQEDTVPASWLNEWRAADPSSFTPNMKKLLPY